MFLLDTDTCIEITKRNANVVRRFDKRVREDLAINTVVLAELLLGTYGVRDATKTSAAIQQLRVRVLVLPIEGAVAFEYARVRSHLQRQGQIIGANDLWIAAHALALDLTLVTNNEREFRRVPELRIENWTRPE